MSGSEDEADFASADEGELETQVQKPAEQKEHSKETGTSVADSKKAHGAVEKTSKTGKGKQPRGKKNAKDEKAKEVSGKAEKTEASSKAQNRKGKGKGKVDKVKAKTEEVAFESETANKTVTLSQEVVDKVTISEEKTMEEKHVTGMTEQKSDIVNSGISKENMVSADSSVPVTPIKKTEESEVIETDKSSLVGETSASMLKSPSSQSIQRPEPDHTQEQEKVLEGLAEAAESKSGWGWGWGSSLLNMASTSVSTFTKEVGEGIHTVMETVESTLNVPAPEKLAEGWEEELDDNEEEIEGTVTEEPHHQPEPTTETEADQSQSEAAADQSQSEAAESMSSGEEKKHESEAGSWFSSWGVSNISDMVQKSGKTFVSGGLDVLESIGKKTFDVIKDHDPGLRKTKGLLFERGDKPNLSQMLRDAKEQREALERQEKECEEARKAHFGCLFDDFQGLAHLEALEMLSTQSEKKVSSLLNALPPETIAGVKPQLLEIKGNFEIGEEDEEVEEQDFSRLVIELFTSLGLGNSPAKLTAVEDSIKQSVSELKEKTGTEAKPEPKEIHKTAIKSLAEFTSKSIEQFHKTGELILIKKSEQTDLVTSSKHLASLTKVLCSEVGIMSTQFTECLNKCLTEDNSAVVNPLVTNVYLEATNSSSYIQDGFQLLLPVLQQTALEKTQEPES